jgi:SNF family Na+-dependent transporter
MSEEPVAAAVAETATKGESRFALKLDEKEEHGQWSSRLAFYMATIGAAVGFGNVWRFPSLAVDYGGGAFFVPYLMALVLLGIPLAILEIGFGQYFQTGKSLSLFCSVYHRNCQLNWIDRIGLNWIVLWIELKIVLFLCSNSFLNTIVLL